MDKSSIKLLKSIGYTISSQFASLFFGFFALAIAVRHISKECFGIFVLFSITSMILTTLFDFGLQDGTIKLIAGNNIEKDQIIKTILGFRVFTATIVAFLLFICSPIFNKLFHYSITFNMMFLLVMFFISEYLYIIFDSFLQGLQFYKVIALIRTLNGVLRLILIWILIINMKYSLTGLILSIALANIFCALLAFCLFPRLFIPSLDLLLLKKILFQSYNLQIMKILSLIYEKTGTILLAVMMGPISVATYEIGYKLPEKFRAIFAGFIQVYFPEICNYRNNNPAAEFSFLTNSLKITAFLGSFLALITFLFGDKILILIFTNSYAESGKIFKILMIALALGFCNHLQGLALIAFGRSHNATLCAIGQTIINVLFNIVLIPVYGAYGVGLAFLLSIYIVNPALIYFLYKEHSSKISIDHLTFLTPLLICIFLNKICPYNNSVLFNFALLTLFCSLCLLIYATDYGKIINRFKKSFVVR